MTVDEFLQMDVRKFEIWRTAFEVWKEQNGS